MSSTELFEAASISITSSDVAFAIATHESHTPHGSGVGPRGASRCAQDDRGGGHVGADPAPAVRAAALPRPGVSSSTPAAASCTAAPPTALAPGGGPPIALSANAVSAVP